MKRLRFILLLLMAQITFAAYGQTSLKNLAEVNHIEQTLQRSKSDEKKTQMHLQLGEWYISNNPDAKSIQQSLAHINIAAALSKKQEDASSLAACYSIYSKICIAQRDFVKGKAYAKLSSQEFHKLGAYNQSAEALVLYWNNCIGENMSSDKKIPLIQAAANEFHLANNKLREGDCYRDIGDLHVVRARYMESLKALKHALELYEQAKNPANQGVYDLLGVNYQILGDYNTAVQYGLLAVKTAELNDPNNKALGTYYNRLGLVYMKIKDNERAENSLRRGLAIYLKVNDTANIYYIAYNISILLLKEKKAESALAFWTGLEKRFPTFDDEDTIMTPTIKFTFYERLKRYKDAEPYCKILENIVNANKEDSYVLAGIYNKILPYYIESGNMKRANFYMAKYKVFNAHSEAPAEWVEFYYNQFLMDSAKGQYISAIKNLKYAIHLKDSLFNEEKSSQINKLNVIYETEKKDKDLLVLKRDGQLQKSHLRQDELIRNIILGCLLSLMIIVFLLVRSQRRKQKTNRLLKEQQEVIGHKNEALQSLNEALQDSLIEKEWLVKEIHHRVKNNLHMIVGLLASQTEFLKGEEALRAITESQNRVQAMSIIHQKLYQTKDLSSIDMASYISDLTEYLKRSGNENKPVTIQMDIDKVSFPLAYSVPIGLIVNEAITNAIKYAFNKEERGIIRISLKAISDLDFVLIIKDNGKGLPVNFNSSNTSSFGMTLMQGLSKEIRGAFSVYNDSGVTIVITFRLMAESMHQHDMQGAANN